MEGMSQRPGMALAQRDAWEQINANQRGHSNPHIFRLQVLCSAHATRQLCGQLVAKTTPEGLLLRQTVTLPIEIHIENRTREFDEAEGEHAKVLGHVHSSTNPPADSCAGFCM
jgi:hypothetical protein